MRPLRELRERKLVQWSVAYGAGAWALIQIADLVGAQFGWPALWLRSLTVVLGIGFFAALILAWYHGEKGVQGVSTVELGLLAGVLILAGAAVGWVRTSSGLVGPESTLALASGFTADATVAEQGSIAVLPFVNMSSDPEQEFFSDGITEELLNVLSQLPELRVASRTSAFSFKGKDVGIDSIARALNVRYVLEGSVRKAGDQVRITAQLIDASTGYHLWSQTYDRELKDIFAVQDEISRSIVDQLQLKLCGGRDGGPLAKQETTDPEAHRLVLKGLYFERQTTREGFERAEALLKQAIARDSNYARAHAALASVYWNQAYRRHGPVERRMRQARAALERALELDPSLVEAHHVAGLIAYQSGDPHEAEASFARAVDLNPGFAPAHGMRARMLVILGRQEEAIRAAERAVRLDPVSAGMHSTLGGIYNYARQHERAVQAYQSALELNPGSPVILGNLAWAYTALSRHAEAIRAAERARDQASQEQFPLATLAYAYARACRSRSDPAHAGSSAGAQPLSAGEGACGARGEGQRLLSPGAGRGGAGRKGRGCGRGPRLRSVPERSSDASPPGAPGAADQARLTGAPRSRSVVRPRQSAVLSWAASFTSGSTAQTGTSRNCGRHLPPCRFRVARLRIFERDNVSSLSGCVSQTARERMQRGCQVTGCFAPRA